MNNKKSIFIIIFLACLLSIFLSSRVRNFFAEYGSFVASFFKEPKKVGAIVPSSSFLAESITRYIDEKVDSIKVLEVGAGTGVFTEKIIEKMRGDYLLDVIEIEPDLCNLLNKKFATYGNVHIRCMSILDWNPPYRYDFIISGLPFNSFDSYFLDIILDKYKKLIKNNGILSYFEYMWAAGIKKFFLDGHKKLDYLQNLAIKKGFRKSFQFDKDLVLLNIPPAYVYHLQIEKEYS